ncbi:MAG: TonB-dependent receptor [Deltaproteobacteria bacterium]|nr:TonB-dependent receptor [Deltaproteobacteria bacterium]
MTPPRVSRFVEAVDPRAPGSPRASTELELDVDREGSVTDARVTRSAGDALLDDAAVAAAKQLVFEPARRAGVPVAARIRFEYVFERPAAAPEPPPPPSPVVEGPPPPPPEPSASPAPPEQDPHAFGAAARVDPPAREVTKRRLESTEMASIAGTHGDPLRAVELMPGVSRPQAGGGLPILRGANPFDSQVFLDGAPVPILYHVGGLTSFVHSRVLDTVDVYPSNFSVRYGRKVGGVIEARVRDPKTDGLHGVAEASLLDVSLLAETPIGDKVAVLAAARRSIIDAVLGAAANSADLAITAAPVYWDYQSIVTVKPTDADRLRLLSYGSSDRLALVLSNPNDVEPSVRGAFDALGTFHRVQAGWRHRWTSGSEQNTEVTYGHGEERGAFGAIGKFAFTTNTVQGRSEWVGVVGPVLRVIGGVDTLATHVSGSYEGVPPDLGEGDPGRSLAATKRVAVGASQWILMPGAYFELGIRPVPSLLLAPGLRADYNDFIDEGALDPRLSLRFDATEQTALKAGIGRYSQSPEERHVIAPIGNPDLRMTHALHASGGVEHKVTPALSVSVEGFVKKLEGVVTGTPDGTAPFYVNAQEGRIFGGELLVRMRPEGRFFGFLSYTLQRSERRTQGEAWRLFDRDQPHLVNATGVYRLGRGWEIGASLRYTSGTPYTPVTSATFDATTDTYSPRLGRAMSLRNPAFSRFDVRLQKTWTFSRWSLAMYLDVQNVLNAPNREGFDYSYDYRERVGQRGLPVLPILGLRGEL